MNSMSTREFCVLGLVQVCGENDHQDEVLGLKQGSRAIQSKSKAKAKQKQSNTKGQEMSRAKPSVPSVLRSLQLSCIAMLCYALLCLAAKALPNCCCVVDAANL